LFGLFLFKVSTDNKIVIPIIHASVVAVLVGNVLTFFVFVIFPAVNFDIVISRESLEWFVKGLFAASISGAVLGRFWDPIWGFIKPDNQSP